MPDRSWYEIALTVREQDLEVETSPDSDVVLAVLVEAFLLADSERLAD
jgi:hypothetical protein